MKDSKKKQSVWGMLVQPPHRSLGTRVLIVFVCVVAVMIMAVGMLSYRLASQSLIGQAEDGIEQTIIQSGSRLDMRQQFYADLSNQLTSNSGFIENLFQIVIPELLPDELERRKNEIRLMLGQLALSDENIRDITLIPLEDDIGVISTIREDIEIDLSEAWIDEVRSLNGRPHWLPPTESGYLQRAPMPLFAYGMLLGEYNIGSHDFILLVQMKAEVLDDLVASIRTSDGGAAAILDKQGRLIAHREDIVIGDRLSIPDEPVAGTTRLDDEGILYAYYQSPESGWTVIGTAPLKVLTKAAIDIRNLSLAIVAGGIIVAFIIGMLLVVTLGRPLSELELLMSRAAEGDFTGRMNRKQRDEIGRVASAYNAMAEQISRLLNSTQRTVEALTASNRDITVSAAETAKSSQEISTAAGHIADGAQGLAESSEQGLRQVEKMGHRVEEVLELQEQMTRLSSLAGAASRQGTQSAEALHHKTSETERRIRTVSERMTGLQSGATSIHTILELMTAMTKQITILSLNASIEAVRAGTTGTGFKVIADEIRTLAEQSSRSIIDVGRHMTQIQTEIGGTITAVHDALPIFEEMVEEVRAVSQVIEEVHGHTDQVVDCSEQVHLSISQLREAQLAMASAIEAVSAVSQEASASTEQVASLCVEQSVVSQRLVGLADHLSVISASLEEQMKRFVVEQRDRQEVVSSEDQQNGNIASLGDQQNGNIA